MRVVTVRTSVVGAGGRTNREWRRNAKQVPAAIRSVTVNVFASHCRWRHVASRKLRAGVIAAKAGLHHGLANSMFRVFFFHARRECGLIEECQRVIHLFDELSLRGEPKLRSSG